MPSRQNSIETLSTIARILQKSRPEENPLAHIVMTVRQEMSVDVCSLYLLQGKTLILVATDGLDASAVGNVRMNVNEGLTGLAVEKLEPVIVNEASQHPRFKFFPETGEEEFHSFAAVPLLDREKVEGVLTIQTRLPRDFQVQEIELLELTAFALAGVIHNLVTLEVSKEESLEGKRPTHSYELKGIPVAPGFGVGPAFLLRPGVEPVMVTPSQPTKLSAQKEWKRLSVAIGKASTDLLKLEKKLQKKFSKHESDIFYSHRMILSDKSFLKKLKGFVQKGSGASEAVEEVIGEYIRHFDQVEDPHFRERAADLEDLRQRIRDHLSESSGKKKKYDDFEGILIAETLVPSDTTRLDPERIRGILTVHGGVTSHAAILARSLGIPAVMGMAGITHKIQPGDLVIVDGTVGNVYINPPKSVLREYEKIQERYADQVVHLQRFSEVPALTLDGRRIYLEANAGLISGLQQLRKFGAEGIGLYRTEFPFMTRKKIPGEEEQYQIYRQVLEEARGLPVTFRLLDAGGDKPIESLGLQREANPFLGYRSIRFSLSRPELLRHQIKALLRASVHGSMRILIPMISGIEEIRAVKEILEGVKKEMEDLAFDSKIPLGIMVEVPAAVWMSHQLIQECDFFSIGTNDLIQYTLAVDRNNEQVAPFFEPLHPAVLNSIAHVIRVGAEAEKPVTICGEIAGDPRLTPLLIGLGVTHLSMIPSSIPQVKDVILHLKYEEVRVLAGKVLQLKTTQEIRNILRPSE